MFNDGAHRFFKVLRKVPRRLQIHDVVIRKLLTLRLTAIRDPRGGPVGIYGGLLMGILSVTQVGDFLERQLQGPWKCSLGRGRGFTVLAHSLQCGRNRRIVGGRGGKSLLRQTPSGIRRQYPTGFLHLRRNHLVVAGRSDDRYVAKIFGGGANHRRPTNVDSFDHLLQLDSGLGGGLLERVEIHHHHVNRLDAVLGDCRLMGWVIPAMQNSSVHLWVKRLHPSVKHLGESGQLGNILHCNAAIAQQFCRATR